MMNRDVLEGVKALLQEPKDWTQGAMARDIDGLPVPVDSPEAVCWCLAGAIDRIDDAPSHPSGLRGLFYDLNEMPLTHWNDSEGRTHAEVVKLLNRAIAVC